MDIDVSVSIDVNKSTLEFTNSCSEDLSVNKPANDVIEFMSTQDDGNANIDSKPSYDEHDPQKKDQDSENCIDDCRTFPCSSNGTSSAGASMEVPLDTNDVIVQESTTHDNVKSADSPCSSSQSLNTAQMPVSAIKGSREKRGATPPQKLTVKWSPDVYDPVPNSVSHSLTNKKPKRPSKKTSKSKQKKESKSRGNKHKEKLSGRGGGG
nr:hypothetical protein [Tanacetum cinerariifolium]